MIDLIKIERFIELAHAGKVYGDGTPYTVHLKAVRDVLIRFGHTEPETLAAGLLHDTIEDTGNSYNKIKKVSNVETAETVYYVTDEKGRNRKEKHERTYPLIRRKIRPKKVKLADRIANTENCIATRDERFDMYKKEYPKFRKDLFVEGETELEPMWLHLDKLYGWTSDNIEICEDNIAPFVLNEYESVALANIIEKLLKSNIPLGEQYEKRKEDFITTANILLEIK